MDFEFDDFDLGDVKLDETSAKLVAEYIVLSEKKMQAFVAAASVGSTITIRTPKRFHATRR